MTPTPDMRKLIPLDKISTYDRSLQVRGGVDPDKVEQYRQIMRDNGVDGAVGYMDPIMVFFETDDGPRWIADGFHRIAAAEAEAVAKIPTILRQGNKSKALRFALGENGHHGAQFSNAEKRKAAELAVLDPEVGKLTDQKIAALIGCSPSLVSDARRGETPAAKATKRAAKKQAPTPEPEPKPEPKPEPEPTAPRAQVPNAVERPTKAKLLKEIRSWVDLNMVDEADIIGLFDSETEAYYYVGRPGTIIPLKVVGKSGRPQCEVETVIKSIAVDGIVLRFEGAGKVELTEA